MLRSLFATAAAAAIPRQGWPPMAATTATVGPTDARYDELEDELEEIEDELEPGLEGEG